MKKRIFTVVILLLLAFMAVFPVLFMLSNSLMSEDEIADRYMEQGINIEATDPGEYYVHMSLLPETIALDGYRAVLTEDIVYLRMFWNSVLITIPILIGQLLISPLAAYGFETMKWRGKEVLFFLYIVVMLMPIQLLMVPHYITAELLGYNNTWWAIILPNMFAPFGTFLVRQQLKTADKMLWDAARVEGASEWRIFRMIVLPAIKPTLAALAVLTFADCWNLVDQAVVFIRKQFEQPLSVYLAKLIEDDPGQVFAASCIFMIPALLVFLMGHEYLSHGIALSAARDAS